MLAGLADDFLRRHRAGERPTDEEYAAAHPALADRIRDLFSAMLAMEQPGLGVDPAPPAERGSPETSPAVSTKTVKRCSPAPRYLHYRLGLTAARSSLTSQATTATYTPWYWLRAFFTRPCRHSRIRG